MTQENTAPQQPATQAEQPRKNTQVPNQDEKVTNKLANDPLAEQAGSLKQTNVSPVTNTANSLEEGKKENVGMNETSQIAVNPNNNSSIRDISVPLTYFNNFSKFPPLFPFDSVIAATNNFAEFNKLGSGTFGVVYKGYYLKTNVAFKRFKPSTLQRAQFQNELGALSHFRHPNIISILGYSEGGDSEMCLVLEFAPNGSLYDCLFKKNNMFSLTWTQRSAIATGIAIGMYFLQNAYPDEPCVHLDLKSANILLDSQFQPKIADFGLARRVPVSLKSDSSSSIKANRVGDANYICPEFDASGKITLKTDVYSYGCILLELITETPSSRDNCERAQQVYLENGNIDKIKSPQQPLESDTIFSTLSQVCTQCLSFESHKRPGFEEIVDEFTQQMCATCANACVPYFTSCTHEPLCQDCARETLNTTFCNSCGLFVKEEG